MKKTKTSVGVIPTQEKKKEEERYIMKNEMEFYLKEDPEYQISVVGEWIENSKKEVMRIPIIYFCHIRTGEHQDSVWACIFGSEGSDENSKEKWKKLCGRIDHISLWDIQLMILKEKRHGV